VKGPASRLQARGARSGASHARTLPALTHLSYGRKTTLLYGLHPGADQIRSPDREPATWPREGAQI